MEYAFGTEWGFAIHGMPMKLAIKCPRCGGHARFDPPFHTDGTFVGERSSGVFKWKDKDNPFTVSPHLRHREVVGVCLCPTCTYNKKHKLNWPADAYYSVSVCGRELWAWDRDYLVALRQYIASTDREVHGHWKHQVFLKYIPKEFLNVRRRSVVLKAIDGILKEAPTKPSTRIASPRRLRKQ